MPDLKLKQIQHECDTWKRQLSFISDENIHLKTRLTQVLNDRVDKNLLDGLENFQNMFVKEDDRVYLLRHEQAELDKLLVREIFENGAIVKKVENKLNKMRNNIRNAEVHFNKLKSSFNHYLLENISED